MPSLVPGDEPDPRRRYTKTQAYANVIWVKWMKEYVPSLHIRGRWIKHFDFSLKAGDLVWVVDSDGGRAVHSETPEL